MYIEATLGVTEIELPHCVKYSRTCENTVRNTTHPGTAGEFGATDTIRTI